VYGKTYVLVVNGGEEPQEARIGLGGVCSAVVPVFGPKPDFVRKRKQGV